MKFLINQRFEDLQLEERSMMFLFYIFHDTGVTTHQNAMGYTGKLYTMILTDGPNILD